MSHKATNWAVSQRGISPVAKVLLWQLADRHNPDNGCFPDQDTLARDCEISRSTVNRILLDLERAGLILRLQRHHPVTKKQLPTQYMLGFEADFVGVSANDSGESRVSNCDTAPEGTDDESRVSSEAGRVANPGGAVSQIQAEPSPNDETRISSLTSKITSKLTSKRAERADRETVFLEIWKAFPMRPGSPEQVAREMFEVLDDADIAQALKGAQRFAAWFREKVAREGKPLEDQLVFVKYLSRWLHERGWVDALKLPVKVLPGTDAAALIDSMETVNRFTHAPLFKACEQLRGSSAPPSSTGNWSFPKELVAEARERLLNPSGSGPP